MVKIYIKKSNKIQSFTIWTWNFYSLLDFFDFPACENLWHRLPFCLCCLWRHASAANQSIKGPSTSHSPSLSIAPLLSLSAKKVFPLLRRSVCGFLIYFGSFLRSMHCAFTAPRPFSAFQMALHPQNLNSSPNPKLKTPVPSFVSLLCCPLNLIPTYLANKINLPQLVWPSS